jgi:rhodanese-related sulfurtransferase
MRTMSAVLYAAALLAAPATLALHDAGRSDLRRLDGGILEWQAQGLPVVAAR